MQGWLNISESLKVIHCFNQLKARNTLTVSHFTLASASLLAEAPCPRNAPGLSPQVRLLSLSMATASNTNLHRQLKCPFYSDVDPELQTHEPSACGASLCKCPMGTSAWQFHPGYLFPTRSHSSWSLLHPENCPLQFPSPSLGSSCTPLCLHTPRDGIRRSRFTHPRCCPPHAHRVLTQSQAPLFSVGAGHLALPQDKTNRKERKGKDCKEETNLNKSSENP